MRFGRLHRKTWGRLQRLLGMTLVAASVVIAIGAATDTLTHRVPSFEEVRSEHHPSDAWIVDRHGEPLESLRTVKNYRSLGWVNADQLSSAFVETLLRAEDRRFQFHHGVDPVAIAGAINSTIWSEGRRGGSTIPMQLAKSLSGETFDGLFAKARYKLRQIVQAIELDATWSKNQILEAYVNRIFFRGEVRGLQAASLGFFRKSPIALDQVESAILVALLRSPNASIEEVQRRARSLVDSSHATAVDVLSREVLEKPLQIVRERTLVPVVSNVFVEHGQGTPVIRTSLDGRIQRLVMEAIREQLDGLKKQNVKDAAVVILETKTGRPVAYAANGGIGSSSAAQVDGAQSRRQLGSTIKAFVYGTAFDQNLISTTSLLLDSPENISIGSGQVYQPKNYDHIFRGHVGAAEALGSSLNVPAVRVLDLVGERAVVDRMRSLGFQDIKSEEQYGPSLALGTVDASLWQLANAYRQLSTYSDSKVFSDLAKNLIFESLSIAENRRFTFGVQSILQLPFAAAVKTGTSKDMRDNWCVGYTSEYTVAVWVGNFSGDPMWNVSGVTGAAPLWRRLMLALHRDRAPSDPMLNYAKPDVPLVRRTISKIRYPTKEMLIGIDPDIPKRLQKIPLRADGSGAGFKFFVNGQLAGAVDQSPFWSPVKGRHRLTLKDAKGKTVDQIQFVVR